jgi:hypothetical protein
MVGFGGSHTRVRAHNVLTYGTGHGRESHHLLAWGAYEFSAHVSSGRGPAISMEKADHESTKSYKRGYVEDLYRSEQFTLISNGQTGAAWMNEVADIRKQFGTKYDEGIVMAERQLLVLEAEGRIKVEAAIKDELKCRQDQLEIMEKAQKEGKEAEVKAAREEMRQSLEKSCEQTRAENAKAQADREQHLARTEQQTAEREQAKAEQEKSERERAGKEREERLAKTTFDAQTKEQEKGVEQEKLSREQNQLKEQEAKALEQRSAQEKLAQEKSDKSAQEAVERSSHSSNDSATANNDFASEPKRYDSQALYRDMDDSYHER